ncbi:pantothenate synthetase [Robiginitalea myxolifaciens]|uniref:Pantothenate synthetase n=1 Tax=Robiginitalea myxolifaciens TaxID=400055 RepID=A0A1I6G725_9FLAO|nr:pantoate--beta-alanine ligase [Robiginitalea myxolifaciens]SFR37994.1 pantothenate synthetase [Robiginitalea myxolifaciens]
MKVLTTRGEMRDLRDKTRADKLSMGLVPTMGALHSGHLELVSRALEDNDLVVVSIFVNPTQFDNPEDLEKYPRTLERDLELLRERSPKIVVFAPEVSEMYTEAIVSEPWDFEGLDKVMEGAYRDGHFEGVATIVSRLLLTVGPDRAYFGEKDYQQLQIIRQLVSNRNIPVEIVPCPIVREEDGLAMSSRNQRLTKRLRKEANFIYKCLIEAKSQFGMKNAIDIAENIRGQFAKHPDFKLEYVEIADAATLMPIKSGDDAAKYRIFIAAFLGGIRLIDNMPLN